MSVYKCHKCHMTFSTNHKECPYCKIVKESFMKMSAVRARAALKKMPQAKRNKLGIKSGEDINLISESRLNSIISDDSFTNVDISSPSHSDDFSGGGGDFGGGGSSGDW